MQITLGTRRRMVNSIKAIAFDVLSDNEILDKASALKETIERIEELLLPENGNTKKQAIEIESFEQFVDELRNLGINAEIQVLSNTRID